MYNPTSFRFGVDFLPIWFKERLEQKEIDFIYDIWGDIVGCRFYNINGKEVEVYKGQKVNIYMMCKDANQKVRGM